MKLLMHGIVQPLDHGVVQLGGPGHDDPLRPAGRAERGHRRIDLVDGNVEAAGTRPQKRVGTVLEGDVRGRGLDLRDFLQAGLVSLAIDRKCGDALRLPLVHLHHGASDPDFVVLPCFASVIRNSVLFVLLGDGDAEGIEVFASGQLHERQPVVPGEQDGLLIAGDGVSEEVCREPPEHRVRREVHGLLELIAVVGSLFGELREREVVLLRRAEFGRRVRRRRRSR